MPPLTSPFSKQALEIFPENDRHELLQAGPLCLQLPAFLAASLSATRTMFGWFAGRGRCHFPRVTIHLFKVVMDRTLPAGNEAGSHRYAGRAQRQGGQKSPALRDTAGGDHGNAQLSGSLVASTKVAHADRPGCPATSKPAIVTRSAPDPPLFSHASPRPPCVHTMSAFLMTGANGLGPAPAVSTTLTPSSKITSSCL